MFPSKIDHDAIGAPLVDTDRRPWLMIFSGIAENYLLAYLLMRMAFLAASIKAELSGD